MGNARIGSLGQNPLYNSTFIQWMFNTPTPLGRDTRAILPQEFKEGEDALFKGERQTFYQEFHDEIIDPSEFKSAVTLYNRETGRQLTATQEEIQQFVEVVSKLPGGQELNPNDPNLTPLQQALSRHLKGIAGQGVTADQLRTVLETLK